MTVTEYENLIKGQPTEHYEQVERMRGGVGTYAFDQNIYKVGDEFHRFTMERKVEPADVVQIYPSKDTYYHTVDLVEEVDGKWEAIDNLIKIRKQYDDRVEKPDNG